MLPALKEEVDKLTLNTEFIDNILSDYDINKDNLCLNKSTKNIQKEKTHDNADTAPRYYYDPEGYLTKEE